jgi:hypothetical protein
VKYPSNFTLFLLSLTFDTILVAVIVDSANLASQWSETVREEKETLVFRHLYSPPIYFEVFPNPIIPPPPPKKNNRDVSQPLDHELSEVFTFFHPLVP